MSILKDIATKIARGGERYTATQELLSSTTSAERAALVRAGTLSKADAEAQDAKEQAEEVHHWWKGSPEEGAPD